MQITVDSYEVFDSAESYEAKEGYEWRKVKISCKASNENAQNYGYWLSSRTEDYYTTTLHDDSYMDTYVGENKSVSEYTVIWHGEKMPCETRYETSSSGWKRDENRNYYCIRYYEWAFCVPVGYDGAVVGPCNFGFRLW